MDDNSAQVGTHGSRCRLFTKRSLVYKIGFGLLIPSCILYLLAFVLPFWFESREDDNTSSRILWFNCFEDLFYCTKNLNILLATRCLTCLCLAGCLLLLVVAFYENCRLVPPNYHSRKLEWLTLAIAFVATVTNVLFVFYFGSLRGVSLGFGYLINSNSIALLYISGSIIAQANRAPSTRQGAVLMSAEMHQYTQSGAHFQPGYCHTPMMHQPVLNAPCAPYPFSPYPPSSAPPPYSLPPAYPGENQPPFSSSTMGRDQRHTDVNDPLIQESKHSPRK